MRSIPMITMAQVGHQAPRQKRRNASGEFWIKPGIYVCQRHGSGPVMTVLRLNRKIKMIKGKPTVFIAGVECRWLNTEGNVCRDVFHTKELIPWENGKGG